jgi:outer membrane protein assembly factor BamB
VTAAEQRPPAGPRLKVMMPGMARLLLAAGSTLTLVACGSTTAPAAGNGPPAGASSPTRTSPPATPAPAGVRSAPASCPPPPPRHAWAVDVTATGRVRWRTPLATRDNSFSPAVPPVTVGAVAVVAQDGIVHGVRLPDGRPLWSWSGGQSVYGLWRQGALVAVLTDQVSDHARLTGLDAATGAVRWSLRLPARGLLGNQALTAGGRLAMAVAGQGLQVVNLADGHVHWRVRTTASPALTAAAGVVIYGLSGHLAGYDARTGQLRWTTAPGVPPYPALQLAGGLVLITSMASSPSIPNTLTAVVPATGRVAWRFDPPAPATDPGAQASVLSAGPSGLAVATYDPRRLYLLDLRTGRPRWHAGTFAAQGTLPLVTGTSVTGVEGQGHPALVARDAATGRVRWRDSLPGPSEGYLPVVAAGTLAILPGEPATPGAGAPLRAYQVATGRLAWQAAMPSFVQSPPVPVPGGLLVQSADPVYACAG